MCVFACVSLCMCVCVLVCGRICICEHSFYYVYVCLEKWTFKSDRPFLVCLQPDDLVIELYKQCNKSFKLSLILCTQSTMTAWIFGVRFCFTEAVDLWPTWLNSETFMFTGQAPLSVHIRSEYIDVHCREGGMAMLVCACVSVCTRACIRLCVYLCVFVNINYRCINNLYINIIFFFKTQLWITAVTIENRCKQCIFISTAYIRVRRKMNRPD